MEPFESISRAAAIQRARAAEVHADSFVGLNEAAARTRAHELGLALRIIDVDEPVMTTDAFALGRVSAYCRRGVVFRAAAG